LRKPSICFSLVFFICSCLFISSSRGGGVPEKELPLIYSKYTPEVSVLADLIYYDKIPDRYKKTCTDIHLQLKIPFKIIYRLVLRESEWRWWAVGKNLDKNGKELSFDLGLCQLNSFNLDMFYWKYNKFIKAVPLKEKNIDTYKVYFSNPTRNLWTGFSFLRYLLDYYDQDYTKALQAYNCGTSRVNKNTVPKTTIKYAIFILTN